MWRVRDTRIVMTLRISLTRTCPYRRTQIRIQAPTEAMIIVNTVAMATSSASPHDSSRQPLGEPRIFNVVAPRTL